jgi:ATP-dependent RNA helicase HelY
VKAVFATETLALGINMPARTVVLEKLTKWNGEGHVSITPGEYTQLTGRAGRRGIDIEGNAVVLWSPTVDSATAAGLASTRTYPLRSSFSPTYNMSINLIRQFGRERARTSLESSFAQFQADRAVVGLNRQIRKNDLAAAEQMEKAICHLGDFAEYASIRRDIKDIEKLLSQRNGKKTFDSRQRQRLESDLDSQRRRMRQHECHGCSDRESHARFAERADRLTRESQGLRDRVENRTHVIAKTFDRICNVLTELKYIDGEKPTDKGRTLAKIYAESDLLLTESIEAGLLNNLAAPDLVAVSSAFIYQSRGSENLAPRIPNDTVATTLMSIVKIWSKLEDIEDAFDVHTQREPDFGFAYAAQRWASGHSLSSILKKSDMTVGDFVRSMKQLIDLLMQIAVASEELREVCKDAVRRIDRGVVAYMVGE